VVVFLLFNREVTGSTPAEHELFLLYFKGTVQAGTGRLQCFNKQTFQIFNIFSYSLNILEKLIPFD
jgi:hypothetical protein